MASNMPARCCTVGVKHSGEATGEYQDINGVETYFSYPEDRSTKHGVLILTDVIGHRFINSQLIADQFAANGYLVAMPDLFHGDPVKLNRPESFNLMSWLEGHPIERVDPVVDSVIQYMRTHLGCEKVGAVGYCFGAKYVVRFLKPEEGKVDVGYIAHPGFVELEELSAITGPLSIAAAETDDIFPTSKRHQSEVILRDAGQPYQINLYGGVEHGFAIRADLTDKAKKFAKEQAFLQAVQWFDEFIRATAGPMPLEDMYPWAIDLCVFEAFDYLNGGIGCGYSRLVRRASRSWSDLSAVMASTEQRVNNASPTLFEMEDRWQPMSRQKPVPTERDTDPVGINSGTEGEQESKPPRKYLSGWKLWLLTAGVWIALFLSTIETTIVSTSLVSITNALNGFLIKDWVVTAYLLTYTGFLTIFAKFSDIFGRKTMLILALIIFSLSSLLCGVSTSIVELIVFRAFQGIGASGIYSMVMVIAPDMVPLGKYGKYMGIVSTVFIVASVLAPILGGIINTHSSWRWVFLFNLPGGLVALILVVCCLPTSETSSRLTFRERLRTKLSKSKCARVDTCGMFLLLASSVLLVFALEEGGSRYPWDSAAIIVPFVLAIIAAVVLAIWEVSLERKGSVQEPVFPPSILKNRLLAAMLLTAFFVGFPFVAIVVNVPQRAQAVSGLFLL
ncbi:hypothetical protein CNMCM8694_008834 [Aspergillus lentulus]|nr:hypothetical protein CNMCM8060_008550 [Aspergillus lentulus]KAF4186545.1 hypothetical protein CNMCM7927_005368 [Aspergillus lentulus]KAF4193489.1 hypothetical protein CNMCM8694_008834 [Aspergillus lentulus]